MAGITIETAKEHLDIWLEAEATVATGQSYRIGSRSLTRADLAEIRNQIKYWQGKVDELEALEKNKGRNKIRRVVPRDL